MPVCQFVCSFFTSVERISIKFCVGEYKQQQLSVEYKFGSVVPTVTPLHAVHIYRSIKMVLCYVT